jgi:glycosyltransferase involved in cell wall biosynthesis
MFGKRILYVQYTNPAPYSPLQNSARILADRGWSVRFLAIGALGIADQFRLPSYPNIEVRQWRFSRPGFRQKLHYLAFGFWSAWSVLRWRPHWVYASDPLICPIALALSFLPGVRVLYHEHDSPSDENVESRKQKVEIEKAETLKSEKLKEQNRERKADDGRQTTDDRSPASGFQRFILWSRKKLARRAALCVLPNEERVDVFKQTTRTTRPVYCVWNTPARIEVIEDRKCSPSDSLKLFYQGSIVPLRTPVSLIQAMAAVASQVELFVAGFETTGNLAYGQLLKEEAVRLGVIDRFHRLAPIPLRADLLQTSSQAHVGLAFMPMHNGDINEQAMTGASMKPFDYLACGLALLVSDLPDWRKMFVEPGYGLACNPADPESIAKALRWFSEHPEETREMGERGRQRILSEWNYEKQFAQVFKIME